MLFTLLALLAFTLALSNPLEPLDKTAQFLQRKTGSPGVAIATKFSGKTSIAAAGVRRNGSTPLIETSDKFHLGSVTKSMTSTLIARLAEKGILSYYDTIGDVLGDLVPNMHPAYKSLTYLHLVSHRSGLERDIDALMNLMLAGTLDNRDVTRDRLTIARTMLPIEPIFEPGSKFQYSNVGYVVAGAMIEATTGKTWETLMQREVFKPLKMKSAGFGAPGRGDKGLTQPQGHVILPWGDIYIVDNTGPVPDLPPAVGPAGTAHANAGDLIKYLDAHRMEDRKFLKRSSWNLLHTPVNESDYAAGWVVTGDNIWAHTGSNGAWYTLVAFSKTRKSQIAMCFNSMAFHLAKRLDRVTVGLLAAFFGFEL